MRREICIPSPKRAHLDRSVQDMAESDEGPMCSRACSSLDLSTSQRRADLLSSTSPRSVDFSRRRRAGVGRHRRRVKRMSRSPDNSEFLSTSGGLWLGSDVGTLAFTENSCGSPVSSERVADWETVGLQQDDLEKSHRQHAEESRKTRDLDGVDKINAAKWRCLNGDSSGACNGGDGYQMTEAEEQRSSLVWMCGRDISAIKTQSGFNWIDLVYPCLDDLHSDQWELLVHSGDLERCRAVFTDALAKQKPYEVEYRMQTSPDNYRWTMETAKPRFSWDRDFLGYVGWRIDIHQQKSFEINLKQYMTMTHEILVEANTDGKTYKDVSPTFPRLLGYTKEEFLRMEWLLLLHPDDREYSRNEFNRCNVGDSVHGVVNRYRCKPGAVVPGPVASDATGTYKWFSWTADKMYGAGRDITAEKIAQEELRRSQAELRRITDAIPGGVFQYKIDENGVETFPYVSKGALDLCSSKSDWEADGETNSPNTKYRNLSQLSGGMAACYDELKPLREAIHQSSSAALIAHANLDCDYRIEKNGEVRWIRVHAVPQDGGNSATKEWCGVTWDITDRHLLEEALREARDVAERSNEAKGIFLANMSHEIRTPMNAVIGSGVLLHETELTEEQREYVTTIRSSGEALLSIINDILDFSKIEAGKLDLDFAPFSISDCIEDSLNLISGPAAQKGLELNYTIAENVPCVIKGDVSRVRQILVNLLSNATKFTEQGSVSVNVSALKLHERPSPTSFLRQGEISPAVLNKDTKPFLWEIKFSVKDSGIGIPFDKINQLFEPFRQLDSSTTRKHEGTGLGLAICARLCALWGGEIKVESVPGEGSTFHFTLTGEETLEVHHAIEEDYFSALKNKRVLVIAGRNSSSQTLCIRLLKSWQVRVVSVVVADDALQEVQHALEDCKDENSYNRLQVEPSTLNEPFMAVVVDCDMTDRSQVVKSLQLCQSSQRRIPSILLTPLGCRFQDYMDGLDMKFTTHVSKPIKESQLRGALMSVVIDSTDKTGLQHATPRSKKWTKRLNSISHRTMDESTGQKCPLKILIAEDNGTNQKVLVRLLQKLGYTADVVGNGIQAVSAALRQSYDVILMDCFMPEMDGLEATKHIRRHVQPCPVIVAVTAAALEEEKRACLQAGLHMYISKPIKAELLIRTLDVCWQVKTQQITIDSLYQAESSPMAQRHY